METSNLLLIALSMFYLSPVTKVTAFSAPCTGQWTVSNYSGTCLLVETYYEWDMAQVYCSWYRHKGHIVRPLDSEMNSFIIDILNNKFAWLGLRKDLGQGYQWDGPKKSYSYLNWVNQTGAKPQLDVCAVINHPSVPRGKWFYLDCVDVAYAVCEKDLVHLCPGEWFPSHPSGTCIKVFQQKETWSAARVKCQAERGDLVMIENSDMNRFVWDQVFSDAGNPYWIGISDLKADNRFEWLESFSGIKYVNWGAHEPKTSKSQNCGALNFPGKFNHSQKWVVEDCNKKYKFICEKNPDCNKQQYGAICHYTCSPNCGGPGNPCNRRTGYCLQGCDSGYQGSDCTLPCLEGTYGANCSKVCHTNCGGPQNPCHHITGSCLSGCDAGYKGTMCLTACGTGEYGEGCLKTCSSHCRGPNNTCNRMDGTCSQGCDDGYKGATCNAACDVGTYGAKCSRQCPVTCAGSDNACNNVYGACTSGCDAGYIGWFCNTRCRKYMYGVGCVEVCSEHCGGDKNCAKTDGSCLWGCDIGYQGKLCDAVCSNSSYGMNCSETCSPNCAGMDNACDNINGSCIFGCLLGFSGDMCDTATPDNGPMSHINDTYWIFIILAVIILLMIALRMYFWKKRREAAGDAARRRGDRPDQIPTLDVHLPERLQNVPADRIASHIKDEISKVRAAQLLMKKSKRGRHHDQSGRASTRLTIALHRPGGQGTSVDVRSSNATNGSGRSLKSFLSGGSSKKSRQSGGATGTAGPGVGQAWGTYLFSFYESLFGFRGTQPQPQPQPQPAPAEEEDVQKDES